MKSRQNLIRFKRFQIDQKRQQLAQIENTITEFHRMADDLDKQIAEEEAKAGISDMAHFAYPTFARAAAQRRDNLMNSAGELNGQLRDAQDALAEAIEEFKKVEVLQERSADSGQQDEIDREQAEMDEIGMRIGLAQIA